MNDLTVFAVVIAFFITLVAITIACQDIYAGSQGPEGSQGPKGIQGLRGNTIVANNTQNVSVGSFATNVNLFTQLSPASNLLIPANSIKIGDVFSLKVVGEVGSTDGSSDIDTKLSLVSGSQLVNISFDDGSGSPYFEIETDITFMTLTTVSVSTSLYLDFYFGGYYFFHYETQNISFDSTVDQTFVLTGNRNTAETLVYHEAMITYTST